jgi:hypothetical protein
VTSVREFVKMLQPFPRDMEIVVDDVVNGCLRPPRLRMLRPAAAPSPDEPTLGSSAPSHMTVVLITCSSEQGDLAAGDGVTLGLMEVDMLQSEARFDEGVGE